MLIERRTIPPTGGGARIGMGDGVDHLARTAPPERVRKMAGDPFALTKQFIRNRKNQA